MSPASEITQDLDLAAATLRRGGLVAFPTETVYGLGADALNAQAVARIFEAKGRPHFDPLIVHIADEQGLARIAADCPDVARRLIGRFWPGPLTLVLRKRPEVPDLVTAGLDTVGVRLPDHPLARELIARCGRPLAAPSANRFGCISPTRAEHVAEQLEDRIDLILDGGPCRVGVESTVLDVTGSRARLLRPGGVPQEDLEAEIGPLEVETRIAAGTGAPAPGMLERHYAPTTRIVRWTPSLRIPAGQRAGVLAFREPPAGIDFQARAILSPRGDLAEAAAGLFAAMRALDAAGLDVIVGCDFPDEGLGRAINDRLRRASAPELPTA
ncbi:MAG: threonylcarbamoyl-AMP synthase [Planctomyces sp.]|nr:threonylcarbamoyl-AMP synthase [Planctomyces sp.]